MRTHAFILIAFTFLVIRLDAQITIHAGHIIDVDRLVLTGPKTILIAGDTIAGIVDGYREVEAGSQLIDLSEFTVMPGFIDMHVHLEGESNPRQYENLFRNNPADVALKATTFAYKTLMAGFTTVRDLGGSGVNVSLRNAINEGLIPGPRIFTAEKGIGTTGGHADPTNGVRRDLMGDPGPDLGVINSPEDARKAVRQRYKNGADLIKITSTGGVLSMAKDGSGPQFMDDEIEAIVQTAKDYGMKTAAHAHGAEGMKRAVLAGISSIEHGTQMTEEIMELMVKHGTYYVPTISAGKFVAEMAERPGFYPDVIVPKAKAIGPQIQATFAKAYKAGVKIAFGTDAGVSYHGDNAKEFIFMTEAGMPAIEAIRSATRNAAELLGKEDKLGSVTPGKKADLVAVKGNPLEHIKLLLDIPFVMKDGKRVK